MYVNDVAVCWVVYGCRSRACVFIIKLSRAFTLCIDIRDTITFTVIIIWGKIVNLPLDRLENKFYRFQIFGGFAANLLAQSISLTEYPQW